MSKRPENDQHDDDRISFLYKQGSIETPAQHINEKILNKSRQTPNNVIAFKLLRIIKLATSSQALAVAAVLVIGVSVILQIQFDSPEALMPSALEESYEEVLLSDQQLLNTSDETSSLTIPTKSQSNKDIVIEQSLSTSSMRAKPTPIKKSTSASPSIERIISQEKERKYKLQSNQHMKARSREIKEKKRLSKQRMQSTPLTAISSEVDSLSEIDCHTLNNKSCLASRNCTLTNEFECIASTNYCDSNFSQLNDSAKQCVVRKGCEYTNSNCQCDDTTKETCSCDDDIPPSCNPTSDDHIDEE